MTANKHSLEGKLAKGMRCPPSWPNNCEILMASVLVATEEVAMLAFKATSCVNVRRLAKRLPPRQIVDAQVRSGS